MSRKNNLLNHRFNVIFTFFQVERNVNPKRKYKDRSPSFLRSCYIFLTSIGLYLFIAIMIHRMMMNVHYSIINNPLHEGMMTDGLTNPSTMNLALLYIICLYLGFRRLIKKRAQFNVISRHRFKQIERDLLMETRKINNGYNVNMKTLRKAIKLYDKVYPALITPSNMEIIMHKRHIDTLTGRLKGVRERITSTNVRQSAEFVNGLKKREVTYKEKIKHHQKAVDVNAITTSINNFSTIQNALVMNDPSYKHRGETLRFKFHKIRTVQDVRNILRDI